LSTIIHVVIMIIPYAKYWYTTFKELLCQKLMR
jgi:hypothetical protein